MDIKYLEKFCDKKGKEISTILLNSYDSSDFEINQLEIEKEIYKVATSYSTIFFFETKEFLEEPVRKEVKSHLESRFQGMKSKRTDIDLIAHWIKLETIKELEENDIIWL